MPSAIDDRLAALGIDLPDAPAPVANYVPFVESGGLVFVSGQISRDAAGVIRGTLGADMDAAAGAAAARTCALALLAQLRAACGGDLDRVRRVVKLTGFVNATPDFTGHPQVIDAASELMVRVFGANGQHARAAVGTVSLPLGAAVEVEGVFEIA